MRWLGYLVRRNEDHIKNVMQLEVVKKTKGRREKETLIVGSDRSCKEVTCRKNQDSQTLSLPDTGLQKGNRVMKKFNFSHLSNKFERGISLR